MTDGTFTIRQLDYLTELSAGIDNRPSVASWTRWTRQPDFMQARAQVIRNRVRTDLRSVAVSLLIQAAQAALAAEDIRGITEVVRALAAFPAPTYDSEQRATS